MSELAISVRGLGKRYTLGRRERYSTLRESMVRAAAAPFRAASRIRGKLRDDGDGARGRSETMWALRNVSFDVARGEPMGIIGKNGAGKSTLLKVLSQITDPTEGVVDLNGRVGSLLEVGTGFHPELSGRENIFLNGAILGMSRAEISGRFDEITAFAGVDRFLDTPVKRYSSGMYTRLAFAVAAHLEPEILVVDEVLAVGDAEFQRKCLGKMTDVASQGRTVLFVSHNMAAVRLLCKRALLLEAGKVVMEGPVDKVVTAYESSGHGEETAKSWEPEVAPGSDAVKLLSIAVRKAPGQSEGPVIGRSDAIEAVLRFEVREDGMRLNPHVHVFTRSGQLVFISTNLHDPVGGSSRYPVGEYEATCRIPGKLLNDGIYDISTYVINNLNHWEVAADKVVSFEVNDDGSDRGDYVGGWHGIIRPTLPWTVVRT